MTSSQPPSGESPFEWIGGRPALDFVNTIAWGEGETANERLADYDALVAWAVEAGAVSASAARQLRGRAARGPAAAARALERARRLRANLHAVFTALATGATVAAADLEVFNQFLESVSMRIESDGEGQFGWAWPVSERDRLDVLLAPVIWWAAEVLVDDETRSRVKTCANDRCGWVFVDESRRRNRRWCDMRDCGNRAKARRYYRRHRSAS